jgi:YegS/Rv2252/BmrU family lipid kinase
MSRKPAIIVNPHAGQKAGLRVNAFGPTDLREVLARQGIDADLWLTARPDHATELAEQAAREGRPLVVAAGGDGTVAEAAAGLVGSETKLGVMPLGSIMNLARMLGIPRNLDAAAETIRIGHSVRIDAGRATTAVGQRVFLEGAGVGVSAALFAYTNQLDSGRWQSLRPMLRFLLRYRPRRMRVTIDGRPQQVRATMVTIANGPLLGAAFELAPDARLDDRQFTVRIFTTTGKRQFAAQVWAILRHGTARQSDILTRRGRLVDVHGRRPLMVHADAHPLGTTPARFELLPAALAVVVPEHPSGRRALLEAELTGGTRP